MKTLEELAKLATTLEAAGHKELAKRVDKVAAGIEKTSSDDPDAKSMRAALTHAAGDIEHFLPKAKSKGPEWKKVVELLEAAEKALNAARSELFRLG